MINIVALSKDKGSSYTVHSPVVTLDSASILKISVSREEIRSFTRINNDLIIELTDHEKITIKNFFSVDSNGQHNDLVLEDPHNGALWWLENPGTDAAKYTSIDSLTDVGEHAVNSAHTGAWVTAGAALLGIGAMLLGSSNAHHSDSRSDNTESNSGINDTPPAETDGDTSSGNPSSSNDGSHSGSDGLSPPNDLALSHGGLTLTGKGEAGTKVTVTNDSGETIGLGVVGADGTFSVTLYSPQTNGQVLNVTLTNDQGTVSPSTSITAQDTTAPAQPSDIHVSDDGVTVTGKAEVGSTVTIKDADGHTLGSAMVGNDGTFTLTLPTAQTNGQTLSVISTDPAGNTSTPVTVTAHDTTAPAQPSDIQVSGDGVTVTGKAEAGSTVAIKDANGNTLGSTTVGNDGTFTLTLPTAQTNGQTLSVISTDPAGNTSTPVTVTAHDTTAPAQASDIQVSSDGVTVTGKAEAGSTVAIKDTDGNTLGSATVGNDGIFTLTLPTAQTNGQTLSVISTDPAGNASTPVTVTAHDTTAPAQPSDVQVSGDGVTVTGKAEAGSTVAIKDANGNTLGSTTVGNDGTFTLTLPTAQTNGQTLSVISTDPAGNASTPVTVTAHDTTAPAQPSDVQVSGDGVTVTGKAEAGSTVAIKDTDGTTLGSATVAADGTFKATLDPAQTNGQTLSVTATDTAGNPSSAATTTAPDTTAPTAPTDVQVSGDGETVTGKAEAGSKVTIKDADGTTIGNTTVGSDGSFTATLSPAQTNGQTLSVTAADAAGNTSSAASATTPDTTAPAAPTDVVVSDDGVTVTGKAEAGSTVAIKDAAGKTLGSATVGADGSFTATLSPAQTNGQTLSVTATDAANNPSSVATTTAPDTTAPAAPTVVQVSGDGDGDGETVTGKAEAGSTVTIKNTDGTTLGSAKVGADGSFTATLSPAQTNGQALSVISTDPAGNASTPVTVAAHDTTAPAQPNDVQVSSDGETVTGKAEAGSIVAIKDADGNALGSAIVAADGTFTATLSPAQTNGQALSVISTDNAGNTSTPVTVIAQDTTAPAQPSDVQLNDTGTTITGKGEVGSAVIVNDANGKEFG
ncbi:BapA prefix-like domain-containing protein [Tatumella sp. TA1]|nr:BapA prefix-like domain-containing protein [Tatumella sp. TA1]